MATFKAFQVIENDDKTFPPVIFSGAAKNKV
jgi:hypothetical protein